MAAHNCPVPSNRQKHLECGGPGVGICIEGKCQCEPQYTGFACGDCALEHESIPAPEWGVNHSFCSKGTTPSISVSQIHTPPISTDTPLQSSANNTTGLVLGVAGALVVVMAIALLYAVRHRHKSRAQFSDSSDVMDAMKQDSDESEGQGASTSRDRFATETVAVDQSRESVLVEMDTIISNPLASQAQQGNVCTRCNAQMRACSLGAPAGSSSCDLILQHSRTPLMRSNSGQGRDSPTARGLTWVAQAQISKAEIERAGNLKGPMAWKPKGPQWPTAALRKSPGGTPTPGQRSPGQKSPGSWKSPRHWIPQLSPRITKEES